MFNAYGNTLVVYASDISIERGEYGMNENINDLGVAMTKANREMLWSNPDAREGTWELDCEIMNAYKWVEMNTYKLLAGGYCD